jgi:hypothetical protein
MENNIIIKEIKKSKVNKYNNLTRIGAFNLEKDCLERINDRFNCKCSIKTTHFPKIISCDETTFKFELTNCGICIKEYNKLVKANKYNEENKIIIINKEEQINCIMENLINSNVIHLDMTLNGKNLCITDEGILSIIDFDIAIIDDNISSDQIRKIYDQYNLQNKYWNNFKNKLVHIINSVA